MYLVTGGLGFIGSHIAEQLVADGHRVRILDNGSSGSEANLAGFRQHVELIRGDIRDRDAVRRATEGVEVIFHLAAEPSVPRSLSDPEATFDINVNGTLQILEAARDNRCRRVVLSSTCAVYGDGPDLPKVETLAPEPLTPYAMSKLTAEQLCGMFTRLYDVETVCLRYFNVFGPRQSPNSAYAAAIPAFIDAVLAGRRPTVFGDGEQSRDFVAVHDVVRANLLAATVPAASGQVMNVARGQTVTINEVLATIGAVAGLEVVPDYRPARPGDILHSSADVSLAREILGFDASVSFGEGIALILEHYPAMRSPIAA